MNCNESAVREKVGDESIYLRIEELQILITHFQAAGLRPAVLGNLPCLSVRTGRF
jgi:hypothetical protein